MFACPGMLRFVFFCSLQTVKQMWPYISQIVEKLFHETIEPAVKASNAHLSTFCFSKVDIGDKVSAPVVFCSQAFTLLMWETTNSRCRWDSCWGWAAVVCVEYGTWTYTCSHTHPCRHVCFLNSFHVGLLTERGQPCARPREAVVSQLCWWTYVVQPP